MAAAASQQEAEGPAPSASGAAAAAPTVTGPGGVSGAVAGRVLPTLPRRVLRSGSAALRQLVDMVGSSRAVYNGVVDLCHTRRVARASCRLGERLSPIGVILTSAAGSRIRRAPLWAFGRWPSARSEPSS